MDFIFSLAHFCEVHGPTSILCTQLLPPSCQTCTTSLGGAYSGYSSEDYSPPTSSPPSALPSRANSVKLSSARLNPPFLSNRASSTRSLSPNESPTGTPPMSPRSSQTLPVSSSQQSLLSTASSGSSETCANCSLTLPKNLSERLPLKDGKKVPVLRSKEVVLAGGTVQERRRQQESESQRSSSYRHARRQSYYQPRRPSTAEPQEDFIPNTSQRRRSLSSASSSNSSSQTNLHEEIDFPSTASEESQDYQKSRTYIPPHTHNITYISTRFPSSPEKFSALRRACVRTLSCEALPGQTGPIFVGDEQAGHTIAYVFRLVDPKIRSNRRTYALLCLCPDVKKIVGAYSYITSVFEQLVTRIKNLATEASRPLSPTSDMLATSTVKDGLMSPGFLRRPARVERGKDLAELVGREQLFVEVHACFATLLGALARRFGCLDASVPVVTTTVYNGIPPAGITSGGLTAEERETQSHKGGKDELRARVMT